MKKKISIYPLMLVGCILIITFSCQKDEPKILKDKVTGSVQKGPFINGTSILMSELNSSLQQTGNIFSTQILNNAGIFELNNISLTSSYVEFYASGYYFDEVLGAKSIGPLNLYALSDITDISTVNVNILTHLEKQRVEYLMKQNESFSEAKKTAQAEILAIFGFGQSAMEASEKLDISVNNESNAILLAISVILQGNRSVGDLTELMANISNDIREDGIMNSISIKDDLRNSTRVIALSSIRANLENRYHELGINVSIPDFEKKINDFLEFTGQKPSVTPHPVINSNTTATSVKLTGEVNPNSLTTEVNFEYGTTSSFGNTVNAFQSPVSGSYFMTVSAEITELLPGTKYYFRMNAVNKNGSTISNELTFTTLGPLIDIEGNIYSMVAIGNQVWMGENLKVTKFNDGSDIPLVSDSAEWISLTSPAYCWNYNDEIINKNLYGALYNWYTVNTAKICPVGWHVPTDIDWSTLTNIFGGDRVAGSKLKESGQIHWINNYDATNESGFTGLPGGYRCYCGVFGNIGYYGFWWSSTTKDADLAWYRYLYYNDSVVSRYTDNKKSGFSIRCIRD